MHVFHSFLEEHVRSGSAHSLELVPIISPFLESGHSVVTLGGVVADSDAPSVCASVQGGRKLSR